MSAPSRSLLRLQALLVAGVLLSALSACGGGAARADDDRRGPRALERLALAGTDPEYAVAGIETDQRFAVPAGALPGGWRVLPPEAAAVTSVSREELGGPWDGLEFTEQGLLEIEGAFDPTAFNRAVVEVFVRAKADLYLELRRGDEVVLRSRRVRVTRDLTPQVAVIDLPETLRAREVGDRLHLFVVPQGAPVAVLGVELVRTPLASWLPSAAEGFAPIAIEGEARHAVGLSNRDPLEAAVTMLPGAELRFAFGRPDEVLRPADDLVLAVEVSDADGDVIAEWRAPVRRGRQAKRWHEAEVELDARAGEALTVRFTLEGEPTREALVALASPRLERRVDDPPAVLLVTSDTHRADHVGPDAPARTPFLDRLAAQGVRFEDCHAAINITNPSHAALLTGLPPRDTGLVDNVTALADEANTLAERFQAAGYYTIASLSAKHMNHGQSGLGQGFDQLAFPPRGSAIDSPEAIEPIDRWLTESADRPVFVWLHVFDAHAPYDVPESHRYLYYDRERDPFDPDLPRLGKRVQASWDPTIRDLAYVVAQYRAEVTYLDEQLAGALAHPRLADAIVAVTADHGEHLGSHDLYWTHQGLYPETLAVPLILSWPGAPAGEVVRTPVDQLDLGRTLLDLADLAWADFPGRNLLRWLDDPDAAGPPRFAIGSHGMAAAVSHEGWFCVLNLVSHMAPRREAHQVELYHVAEDPTCSRDRVDEDPERARAMRALLVEWLAAAPPGRLARRAGVSDPEVLAQLSALGYATEGADDAGPREVWFEPDPENEWDRRFGARD